MPTISVEKTKLDTTIPIFKHIDSNWTQIGSGILYRQNRLHYLITATHVLDAASLNSLYIPINGYNKGLWLKECEQRPNKKDNDVTLLAFPSDYYNILGNLPALEPHDICAYTVFPLDLKVLFAGFPESRSKVYEDDDNILTFKTELCPLKTVIINSSNDFFSILFDEKNLQNEGKRIRRFPLPYGMSGGGVWSIDENTNSLKLIGILSKYKGQKEKYIEVAKLPLWFIASTAKHTV